MSADQDQDGDMRHSSARTSAITALHRAMRHASPAEDDQALARRAEFHVDLALNHSRGEALVLLVGDDTTARRLAAAVIAGNPEFPADYEPSVGDVAEAHRVIQRMIQAWHHG